MSTASGHIDKIQPNTQPCIPPSIIKSKQNYNSAKSREFDSPPLWARCGQILIIFKLTFN